MIDFSSVEQDITSSNNPVLLYFTAKWCGPCRSFSPIIEDLSGARSDIRFIKVDVDLNPDLSMDFMIQSVPTVFLVINGKKVASKSGLQSRQLLESWIDSNI